MENEEYDKKEEMYTEWKCGNYNALLRDFVSNDPMYKEFCTYPEADCNETRQEYIELQGLEDEFNEYCKEEFDSWED